ncbi:MAG: SDR family oxidoreductase [Desulfobacteraceae bacterium]|jgi:NAD(P)-dependent dehydrogenase (short-subunit alcohol dehydrogenase family)|nr:SDR family oxidoreductase [Desulfobacteraceae bacterium]
MNLPYFDLTDKVAIITGGATGIGRGIAEGLADAGASIVIAARRLKKCEEACKEVKERTGIKTLPHQCDITNGREIEEFVEDVIRKFGHIDILVNNSGTGGSEKPILKMTEDDWDRVNDTNLKGVFLLSRAVVDKMVERGKGGKIINVVSIGSMIGWPNMSAYCASKGGCLQLTKVMALEWVRYNIHVNAILPGYFETPMNREFFSSDAGKKAIKASIPMRRVAKIEEMKGVAILLASEASSFMTGSAIVVDGGHTCW